MKLAESELSFESESREGSDSVMVENNAQGLFKFNRRKNNGKTELNDKSEILDAKLNHLTN